jgi:hypothetical protein
MPVGIPNVPITMPSGTVAGRLALGPGPVEAVPLAALFAAFGSANLIALNVAGTNTITCVTSSAPALPVSAVNAQVLLFTPAATNTGAVTLARDGLTALAVVRNGLPLTGGELQTGIPAVLYCAGTSYSLLSQTPVTNQLQGADVASAATVNLDTVTGDYINVTGTVTITAITLAQGHVRRVKFAGALLLTNGVSLILPGGMSITTAAGDMAEFIGEAAGVVRCAYYIPAAQSVVRLARRKTADQSQTSNTTFTDDADLTFAIGANEEWLVTYEVMCGAALGTTGVRVKVNGPSGVGGNADYQLTGDATGKAQAQRISVPHGIVFTAANFTPSGNGLLHIAARVVNGATPGNVTLQWAQETSSATALTFASGSFMQATRVT